MLSFLEKTKEEFFMDDINLDISDEVLKSLSIEQLADLKVEVDELLERIDNLIEDCDEVLNS